jgi:hypothetical protein
MTEHENTAAPYTKLIAWLKSLRANATQKEADKAEKQAESNNFTPEQKEMLKNIVELKDTRLDDLMIPRADIVALPPIISLWTTLDKSMVSLSSVTAPSAIFAVVMPSSATPINAVVSFDVTSIASPPTSVLVADMSVPP